MHKHIFLLAAFGWLSLGGLLHFLIDVISQYVRGKRVPSPETTLFYGMNTAYAFGQVVFGLAGLWLAGGAREIIGQPLIILSLIAAAGWLAIGLVFFEYWEPKFVAAVFGVLIMIAVATA
jgi:hypothetical protein